MKYGFIGCGNMGGAIARALSQTTKEIVVSDRSGRAKALAEELGIQYGTVEECAACQRVFVAVKPHMVRQALAPFQQLFLKNRPTVITMAAGLTTEDFRLLAGTDVPVVRIMPNTPSAIGKGVVQYCCNPQVEQPILDSILQDLRFCGHLDPLDEGLMDAGSALSGCGPAYAYLFIEALADGAVACGLSRAKALEYAAATLVGAGEMVLATGLHPGQLKDAVCSPGGSTIQGIRALEAHGFRGAVMECVLAAYEKNKELGK